jgi:hypothetical protein
LVFDLLDEMADLLGGPFRLQAQDLKLQSPHSVALLSVRRERPRRRPAEPRDEFPPSHF